MVAATIAWDQLSKWLVVSTLAEGESSDLAGGMRIVHAKNTGVAFSLGRGSSAIVIPILVLTVVLALVIKREFSRPLDDPAAPGRLSVIAFSLIIGGALGNIVDRLFRAPGWGRGAVVDFVDVGFWPVFNIADSALVVGVIAMVAVVLLQGRSTQHPSAPSNVASNGS